MNQQKTFNLLPKQLEFVNSDRKETLAVGAWGSSKSTALCFAVLKEACIPNSQILLCRKTYTSLKRSTLQTLLYGSNPIMPKGSYKYNKVDQTIKLNGLNSTIYLMGLDSMEKIRSMNLSFIAIDEASELNEMEWIELLGRLRCETGSRRLVACCNPSSPSHFLYQRFYVNRTNTRNVIKSTALENPYLPADYIENLKTLPKQLYDRYVLGEWIALDKAIYSMFDREKHIKTIHQGEFNRYVIGLDFGFTNPIGLTFWGIDGDNNAHLLDELKESGLLISRISDRCEKFRKFEPTIVVDPSAPALIAQLENDGYTVVKADNDVEMGISRVQNYIGNNKISIEPHCSEFIKEIENYIRDDKGKPIKIEDHLCDSTRYAISYITADVQQYTKPCVLVASDFDDED
jgi:phage terminase large subunit